MALKNVLAYTMLWSHALPYILSWLRQAHREEMVNGRVRTRKDTNITGDKNLVQISVNTSYLLTAQPAGVQAAGLRGLDIRDPEGNPEVLVASVASSPPLAERRRARHQGLEDRDTQDLGAPDTQRRTQESTCPVEVPVDSLQAAVLVGSSNLVAL